jgi:N-acetyl-D-muramate 6-phosphate phosphatase
VIKAVLFDLDGTLADTAPDLGFAVNRMREDRGLPPLPAAATRPVTSLGARGLLNAAFGISPGHGDYGTMREEFLQLYESNICRHSRLFPGMADLLEGIVSRRLAWGIVTNKAERLARLLLDRLDLPSAPACIVGGDTTAYFKPHPEPLFAACRLIQVDAPDCIYIGDDQRDVDAGRAAGMKTAVAEWGYLNGGTPARWNPDWMLSRPADLLPRL